jgi:hypothetical protein
MGLTCINIKILLIGKFMWVFFEFSEISQISIENSVSIMLLFDFGTMKHTTL